MTRTKIAVFVAFLFLGLAVFEYLQVRELKDDIEARDSLINLLDSDYQALQSDYALLQDELDSTQAELNRTGALLEEIKEQEEVRSVRTYILGVRDDEGVAIPLEIEVRKGNGGVFVDVGEIFLEDDVQSTLKTAFALGDVLSDGDLAGFNAYVRMVNPYSKTVSISGSSSGAMLTMSLIALGKNMTLKKGVMITGTVKGDGSIRPVLYISQKAEAAKSLNATVMLVPAGQKVPVDGIELIEVSSVEEAVEYMLE